MLALPSRSLCTCGSHREAHISRCLRFWQAGDCQFLALLCMETKTQNSTRYVAPDFKRRQLVFDSFAKIRQVLNKNASDADEEGKVLGGTRGERCLLCYSMCACAARVVARLAQLARPPLARTQQQ